MVHGFFTKYRGKKTLSEKNYQPFHLYMCDYRGVRNNHAIKKIKEKLTKK